MYMLLLAVAVATTPNSPAPTCDTAQGICFPQNDLESFAEPSFAACCLKCQTTVKPKNYHCNPPTSLAFGQNRFETITSVPYLARYGNNSNGQGFAKLTSSMVCFLYICFALFLFLFSQNATCGLSDCMATGMAQVVHIAF